MYGNIYLARPAELCYVINKEKTFDENDCQNAADVMPFVTYNGTINNKKFPKGCFLYGNEGVKLYWNNHAIGMEDRNSRRVCNSGRIIFFIWKMYYLNAGIQK